MGLSRFSGNDPTIGSLSQAPFHFKVSVTPKVVEILQEGVFRLRDGLYTFLAEPVRSEWEVISKDKTCAHWGILCFLFPF